MKIFSKFLQEFEKSLHPSIKYLKYGSKFKNYALQFSQKNYFTNSLSQSLKERDSKLYQIIENEKNRLKQGINLIASENLTSKSVYECLGSVLTNKYSEGYPGQRYYGGNEFIDQSEMLCQERALKAFRLKKEEWGVNVQALSGSPANFWVYSALLNPQDRLMGMDLPHGGHLSHGYQLPNKKISYVSKYFQSLPYKLNEKTGLIDYDKLEEIASLYQPKLLIAGYSCYTRNLDFKRFRKISDKVGAILMTDMSHFSGLVAADVIESPFPYSDIVTSTTHKTLRGPRGAMIFFRDGLKSVTKTKDGKEIKQFYDFKDKINQSVFPGHQGGPHNHVIAGISTALLDAQTENFKNYQKQVIKNAQTFANYLIKNNYKLISNGTDNHIIWIDMKSSLGIDGGRVENMLEKLNIFVNKNSIPGDQSALVPSGIRIGTPTITTRGLKEKETEQVAQFFIQGCELAKKFNEEKQLKNKKIDTFKQKLNQDWQSLEEAAKLKQQVIQFISQFDSYTF